MERYEEIRESTKAGEDTPYVSAMIALEWSYKKLPFKNVIELTINHIYENFNTDQTGLGIERMCFKINGQVYEGSNGEDDGDGGRVIWTPYSESTILNSHTIEIPYNKDGTMPPITVSAGDKEPVYTDNTTWYDDSYITHSITIEDLHNIKIKKDNTWKRACPFVKVGGVFKRCIMWKKINGTWKKGV